MVSEYIIKHGKEYGVIYTAYVKRNGKKIYPKKGRSFRLEIPVEKLRTA